MAKKDLEAAEKIAEEIRKLKIELDKLEKSDPQKREEIEKLKKEIEMKQKKLETYLDLIKNGRGEVPSKGEKPEKEEQKPLDEIDTELGKEKNQNHEQEQEEKEQKEPEQPTSTYELKLTLIDWQIRTGIEIVPDDYIRKNNPKFLTEQEYREILQYENVPKIIKDPGSAERFFKTGDDWKSLRTSMDTLKQAIQRGDFPRQVDDNDYILMQYSNTEVRDENGDGYLNLDDLAAKEDMPKELAEAQEKIQVDEKGDNRFQKVKEVYDGVMYEMLQNGLTESIENDGLTENIGQSAVNTVGAALRHSLESDIEKELAKEPERDEEGEFEIGRTPPRYD